MRDLLWGAWDYYWTDGRFFALIHLGLMLWMIWEIIRFARWAPLKEAPSAAWSQLDSRVDYLRGWVGLFLLVGIAGTFFGLFEFAFSSSQASTDLKTFSSAFSSAARKAFPVGFFGIVWAFGFNVLISFFERRHVKKLRHKPVRETVVEEVQYGLEKLEEGVVTALDRIGDMLGQSLAPVKELQQTLGHSLDPMFDRLRESLDKSRELLAEQGGELHRQAQNLEQGRTSLTESSQRLADSAKQMTSSSNELVKAAQVVGQGIEPIVGKAQAALAEATGSLVEATATSEEARKTLETCQQGIAGFWDHTQQHLDGTHAAVGKIAAGIDRAVQDLESLPEAVQTSLQDLVASARDELGTALQQEVAGAATTIHHGLDEASGNVRQLSADTATTLKQLVTDSATAIRQLATECEKAMERLTQASAESIECTSKKLREGVDENAAHIKRQLAEAIKLGFDDIARATQDIAGRLNDWIQKLSDTRSDFEKLRFNFEQSQHYIAEQLQETVSGLSESFADEVTRRLDRAFAGLDAFPPHLEEFRRALDLLSAAFAQVQEPVRSGSESLSRIQNLLLESETALSAATTQQASLAGVSRELSGHLVTVDRGLATLQELPEHAVQLRERLSGFREPVERNLQTLEAVHGALREQVTSLQALTEVQDDLAKAVRIARWRWRKKPPKRQSPAETPIPERRSMLRKLTDTVISRRRE